MVEFKSGELLSGGQNKLVVITNAQGSFWLLFFLCRLHLARSISQPFAHCDPSHSRYGSIKKKKKNNTPLCFNTLTSALNHTVLYQPQNKQTAVSTFVHGYLTDSVNRGVVSGRRVTSCQSWMFCVTPSKCLYCWLTESMTNGKQRIVLRVPPQHQPSSAMTLGNKALANPEQNFPRRVGCVIAAAARSLLRF